MNRTPQLTPLAATMAIGFMLSACGGGSGSFGDGQSVATAATTGTDATATALTETDMTAERWKRSNSSSTPSSASTTTTASTTTSSSTSPAASASAAAASLTLTNLPASTTTNGTASIGYQLATTNSSYSVLCRRDSYTPIPCPNPFVLGAAKRLAAGEHQVDFYIDQGTSVDLSRPVATYSWTITDAAATASTVTAGSTSTTTVPSTSTAVTTTPSTSTNVAGSSSTGTPVSATPSTSSSATPLADLPYPVGTTFTGTNTPSVTTSSTVTGSDGIVRLAPVADPGGSGQQVYLHRIVRNDGNMSGNNVGASVRAEKLWIDQNRYMLPGNDYWLAFAFRPKANEWPANSGMGDDDFLVMQTHSESTGDTQPPIALAMKMGLQKMRWFTSYSAASQATSQQGVTTINDQALPATEVWQKYVVHIRPGYLASHNPITEVWMATGSSAYTKIATSTALNDYNWKTGSYARIGFYKWSGTGWSSSYPTIAAYFTSLHMETGANKYDNAVAALAGLK